jgi:Fe2+ transport system protein B
MTNSTHPIDSDLMDKIIDLLKSKYQTANGIQEPAKSIIEELNQNRDWVIISVLHAGHMVEKADDPDSDLAWESREEIANEIMNDEKYSEALDDAIHRVWTKYREEHKPEIKP